jgi:hypothetical protein
MKKKRKTTLQNKSWIDLMQQIYCQNNNTTNHSVKGPSNSYCIPAFSFEFEFNFLFKVQWTMCGYS